MRLRLIIGPCPPAGRASRHPTLLVVDDADRARPEVRAALRGLSREIGRLAVLAVVAGQEAASRVDELGTWYDGHAQHATAAAAALEHQGDNFGRVA